MVLPLSDVARHISRDTQVTDPDLIKELFPLVDISQLKFKEHDELEAIFKFWRNPDPKFFPIAELWDERLRT